MLQIITLLLIFSSCDDVIEVENISNLEVILIAPTERAAIPEGNINFSWDSSFQDSNFRLQVAYPNFVSPDQILLDTLLVKKHFILSLEPNNYEWRVRAENSDYQTVYSSNRFIVEEQD